MNVQSSAAARGPGRPVARRTRTFRKNYVSFAGTYQCNLGCPHCCVPIEWTDRLDIDVAIRFLEQAHAFGIRILGFTGGEPFVYPEFVIAVARRGAELGFPFDRIVTNGVWHRGKVFREGLTAIREEILARDPAALPGSMSSHCFFCWYVLTRGLAADMPGGGGQVGARTGSQPEALVQLGLTRTVTH